MIREVTLEFRLATPPDVVIRWLGDMDRLVEVHPLLVSAAPLGDGAWRIRERVAGSPFPLVFGYPAWVEVNAEARQVRVRVRIWKVIRATMTFCVHPDGTGSRVREHVRFDSRLPVAGPMSDVFRKEHAALFRNLERRAVRDTIPGPRNGERPATTSDLPGG